MTYISCHEQSPYADCKLVLKYQKDRMLFRGEWFSYIRFYYLCPVTMATFVSSVLDRINWTQIRAQYRTRHRIPAPDELIRFRIMHGLDLPQFAKYLGLDGWDYDDLEDEEFLPPEEYAKHLRRVWETDTLPLVPPDAFKRIGTRDLSTMKFRIDSMPFRDNRYDYLFFYTEEPETFMRLCGMEEQGVNEAQVITQYVLEHNIPLREEYIRYRFEHGLTPKEMAERVGVDEETYQRYEGGAAPTPEDGEKLRAAMEG